MEKLEHLFTISANTHHALPSRDRIKNLFPSDAGRRIAFGTNDHDIRGMDRPLPLNDTTLGVLLRWSCVALHDIYALDNDAVLLLKNFQNLSGFPSGISRNHHHIVIFAQFDSHIRYQTSGASETIFI